MRALTWAQGRLTFVDQTQLPQRCWEATANTVDDLVEAITSLRIRGAPVLGAAGAWGVVLAARQAVAEGWDNSRLRAEITRIREARPTAPNLARGVDQILTEFEAGGLIRAEHAARELEDHIARVNHAIGRYGADYIEQLCGRPVFVHTHCHTGELACLEWGTALGIIRTLHGRELVFGVLVDETRPLLQGSRITAWELGKYGIPHRLLCDGAGPYAIARGMVDIVLVGADRITANGDVANKIGTYGLALAAAASGIPFIVAAPESTLDRTIPSGADIPIEERPAEEITTIAGVNLAPADTDALNPAFDVTPHALVTAIVTELGVLPGGRDEREGTSESPAAHPVVTGRCR